MTEPVTIGEFIRAWRASRKPSPPRVPYKAASVTAFRAFIEVHALSVQGGCISDRAAAQFILPTDVEDVDLGRHVRQALAASKFFQPSSPDWDGRLSWPTPESVAREHEKLMALAKARTLGALFKGARHVGLDLKGDTITIGLWEHKRTDHFTGFGAPPLTLPADATDEALGAAVREGLALSR